MFTVTRDIERLSDGVYDVLIVGGGIVGAGAARDAALRGLRVALIDQGDFASGTSSRSSKLIHGGLRYLQHAEVRLVREACVERATLLRIAPHLVEPLPLLFPCYRKSGPPVWKLRLGLWIYDLLAGSKVIRSHEMLSAQDILNRESALNAEGLEGGGVYYDCRMNDARLCLENALDAARAGATIFNYVKLMNVLRTGGRIDGAVCMDLETGREAAIRFRAMINAAGPWADQIRRMDDGTAAPVVRKTKGVHLVTRRLSECGIAAAVRQDGRMIFILPFPPNFSLIGTTDTDSNEDPDEASINVSDVDYLLSAAQILFPRSNLNSNDVISCFAGLRTLISTGDRPSDASREYFIEESRSGMISVIGGKYTTYRAMAERVVDRIMRRLGKSKVACQTAEPLTSADGARSADAAGIATQYPDGLSEISPGCRVLWGEAVHAIRREGARRPMDFLRRRTDYCLTHRPDAAVLTRLSDLFQKELGWDDSTRARLERQSLDEWNRFQIRSF